MLLINRTARSQRARCHTNIDIYAHIAPYTFFMIVKYEARAQRLFDSLGQYTP